MNIEPTYVKEGKRKMQSIASLVHVLFCCGVSKSFDSERESRTSRIIQRDFNGETTLTHIRAHVNKNRNAQKQQYSTLVARRQ